MHSSLKINYNVFPIHVLNKKRDHVDKGTTRNTPGNNEGARPPKKEDYEKVQDEKNEKETKDSEKEGSS